MTENWEEIVMTERSRRNVLIENINRNKNICRIMTLRQEWGRGALVERLLWAYSCDYELSHNFSNLLLVQGIHENNSNCQSTNQKQYGSVNNLHQFVQLSPGTTGFHWAQPSHSNILYNSPGIPPEALKDTGLIKILRMCPNYHSKATK